MDQLNKEIQDIRLFLEKKVNKDLSPVLAAYKRALNDIRSEIAKLFAQYAVNGELKVSKEQRYTILKKLEQQLLEQARELGLIDLEHTTKTLYEVYRESYYRTAYVLESGITSAVNFSLLRPEFVLAAVQTPIEDKMFSDRIWTNKTKLVQHLRLAIEKGMIQGVDVRKLANSVKREFEVSAFDSRRLIFTEMSRVMGQAQTQIYKDSGVVEKVLWDATLDGKTSDICRERDGNLYELNNVPKFPAHPFERSCLVPVVDGWSPNKKRENIKDEDGSKPIISYSSYDDWAKAKGIN